MHSKMFVTGSHFWHWNWLSEN